MINLTSASGKKFAWAADGRPFGRDCQGMIVAASRVVQHRVVATSMKAWYKACLTCNVCTPVRSV
jgi:hypothetical protein